jgi:hypothetical protein
MRYERGLSSRQVKRLIGLDYTILSKIEKEEGYPQIISVKSNTNV